MAQTNSPNIPIIDLENIQSAQALFDHDQINLNSTKKPANVVPDKFDEVRIRIGQIDNYLIERNGQKIDPLKTDQIINMKTGKVVVRWIDYSGGIIRPEQFGYPSEGFTEPWTYYPDKDSKYPEKRTLDAYNHDKASDKEMIELTHAFIWNNGSNWCGMNYLPPVGSIVVVGFKKNNLPVILGYLQTDYSTAKPYIKPGETLIKGYGENYMHWRWSDKLDIHLNTTKDKIDLDDPYKNDKYPNTIEMWMRFDCYTRNIVIDVNQLDEGSQKRTTIEVKPESVNINSNDGNNKSSFTVSPTDIYGSSGDSNFYVSPSKVTMASNGSNILVSSSDISIKSAGTVNIQANSGININSNSNIDITSNSNINMTSSGIDIDSNGTIILSSSGTTTLTNSATTINSSGNVSINGSKINLN